MIIGVDIPYQTRIGNGFKSLIPAVINENAFIGDNVWVRCNTVIGNNVLANKVPVIEDNVTIGANCCIIGNVAVGLDSIIGAGTIMVKDIPPFFVGNPGREIKTYCKLEIVICEYLLHENGKV